MGFEAGETHASGRAYSEAEVQVREKAVIPLRDTRAFCVTVLTVLATPSHPIMSLLAAALDRL